MYNHALVQQIAENVVRSAIGWKLVAAPGDGFIECQPHSEHIYEASCAVCRASDQAHALESLVGAVLAIREAIGD